MPPEIQIEVIPERTELRLSDSMRLDIIIRGPAPLRLDLPKEWLGEASTGLWKMESLGKPTLTDIADGGQCWSQSFRLDPYAPGTPVPLIFSAVVVNGRDVNLPSFSIPVTTTVANAKIEEARPITGIETLPPKPVIPATNFAPWFLGGLFGVALAVIVLLRRRTKPQPESNPNRWASEALAKLNAESATFVEDVAAVLRGYIRRVWGVPAETRTTAELRGSNPDLEPFLGLLDRCDRAKYAGEPMNSADREELRKEILFILG